MGISNIKNQISKMQCKKKNFGPSIAFLISALCVLGSLSGCATFFEVAKGAAGISTKVLEDGRKEAVTKTFNYDYFTCYFRTKEILKRIKAYIYAEDEQKELIAIYVSEEDTTPVGLFFSEIDQVNTQIEVSSPSIYAREHIASKLFSALEKSGLEEEEAPTDKDVN